MSATQGQIAFMAYAHATGADVRPWAEQDQRSWEKAAGSIRYPEADDTEGGDDPDAGPELRLDEAHAEEG